MQDLTGNIYGRLTVVEMMPRYKMNSSGAYPMYCKCECSCGNKNVVVSANKLKTGWTKSCGCLVKENTRIGDETRTHGKSETKAYAVWRAMRDRCNRPENKMYKYYGGNGVSVCDEWNNSFDTFYEWLVINGYVETAEKNVKYTIDRIDVNKGYCPENCRIVSQVIQANNKTNNRYETYNGETHTVAEWARIAGIKYKTLCNRLYKGWSFERAITTCV